MKIETQIKKQMETFIAQNGMKDTDITIAGIRYFLIAPNRFGPGYIRIITPDTVWSSDLNRKDTTKVSPPRSKPAVSTA